MPPLSPVHELLDPLNPHWGRVGDRPIALHFGAPDQEMEAARTLGLCDLSALPRLGIKGPAAGAWLRAQSIDLPDEIYDTRALPDGGVVARIAADEFILESGPTARSVPDLAKRLGPMSGGVYRVERQGPVFGLSGSRRFELMAQTCGLNLRQAPLRRLIYSQVAGASCGILPETLNNLTVLRLWIDPSLAVYLWQTLAEISAELGGRVVGAVCFYPNLA